MIKINGTTIKTPSAYTVNVEDIVKADRNTYGDMLIERIATKRKLELSWSALTNTELQTLLSAVSNVKFSVEYPDTESGTLKTGTFYAGSKSAGMIQYNNGVPTWSGTKFNLIEV